MELFNVSTREREDINDPDALHQAILAGTHSFKKGAKVAGYDPQGKPVNIPSETVADAIQSGYKVNTSFQNRVEAEADKPENSGIKGALKVGLQQAGDELLMGIPEMVADDTQDPFDVAVRQELKKRHEIANTVGSVAGFGGSLFLGGPLWKGAAKAGQKTSALLAEKMVSKSGEEISKSAAKRIAGSIVKSTVPKSAGYAVEGAISTAPIAITEAALGDPEAAAESLLLGMGFGGIVGGATGAGGAMGSKFKNLVKDTKGARAFRQKFDEIVDSDQLPKNLRSKADEKYYEALDPKKKHQKLDALEEVYDEEGNLVSLTRSEDKRKIGETLRKEGIFEADGLSLPDKQQVYDRITTRANEYAQEVGSIFQELDETFTGAGVNMDDVVENIRANVIPELKKNKAIHREVSRFEKELDMLKSAPPAFSADELGGIDFGGMKNLVLEMPQDYTTKMSLREANTLKAQYQKQIQGIGASETIKFKDLLAEIPREINRQIRKNVSSIDQKVADDLIRKQKTLGNLRTAEKIAKDRAEAAVANNDFGLTSYMTGIGGAAVFDAGALSVPVGLALGASREFTRRHGDLVLAKGYDKIGGLLFAEEAMKDAAKKIQKIPEILQSLSRGSRIAIQRARPASYPALTRLMKDSPEIKTPSGTAETPTRTPQEPLRTLPMPKKKLKELREQNEVLASNPAALMERIEELIEPFSKSGAPQSAAALSARISQVVNYISQVIPKPPRPNNPFAPHIEWEPSDYEVASFDQKLQVIMDPFTVFDELQAGTLTKNHMEALKTIYPVIHSSMQRKVQEAVVEGVDPIPYQERVKLSILMDAPMDSSLESKSIAFYTSQFDAKGELDDGQDSEPMTAEVDIASNQVTQSQRILGG